MESISSLSAGAYTATLDVTVTTLKGGATPILTRADFSIMMKCMPEIGNCHSVYTLWLRIQMESSKILGENQMNKNPGMYRIVLFHGLTFWIE
jgi:hypothetical protein